MTPGMGRFMTPDTKNGRPTNPGSWNKYAYTGGDPINRVDRLGRDWCVGGDTSNCVSDEFCDAGPDSAFDPSATYVAFCEGGEYVPERDVNNDIDSGGGGVGVSDGGDAGLLYSQIVNVPTTAPSDTDTDDPSTGSTTSTTTGSQSSSTSGGSGGSNLPSCFGNFITTWGNLLNPFPSDDVPARDSVEIGSTLLAHAYKGAAIADAAAKLLSYPLKSSVFRTLWATGEMFEAGAASPVYTLGAGVTSLVQDYESRSAGTCQ
jgi:hypothetical protein